MFRLGERVLHAPTGQWATVIWTGIVNTGIAFEEEGVEVTRRTGDLIPEEDVDDADLVYGDDEC